MKLLIAACFTLLAFSSFAATEGVNLLNSNGVSLGVFNCKEGPVNAELTSLLNDKKVQEIKVNAKGVEILFEVSTNASGNVVGYNVDRSDLDAGCTLISNF